MTNILRETQILSFAEFTNPYLKKVKFIFADDKPNLNNQAIPYDEFTGLAASAIGMPIKIRFLGRRGGAGNHEGSVPIGHISDVIEEQADDGTHNLVAQGVLYADEYPDIIEYLEEAYAENKAPGISWEISYHDSIVEKGITILKGVIARAATFVKHPAYGKRTALLALASIDMAALDNEAQKKIMSLVEELLGLLDGGVDDTPGDMTEAGLISKAEELIGRFITEAAEVNIQGGNNNVTLEEALAKIAELEAELASTKTELEAKASETQTLEEAVTKVEQLEATVTELETAIATYEKAYVVANRTQKMVEAGVVLDEDAEVLAQKQELWAAMSEEIFNEVISTVTAVASKAPEKRSEASARIFNLPKITPPVASGGTAVPDLMSRMRALSRNDEPAE
jgi:exonuclease VII small subunit